MPLSGTLKYSGKCNNLACIFHYWRRPIRFDVWSSTIIGEATKNLPDDFKTLYPSVAWKQVAGLRDVIAHGYFRVDFEVLWEIITDTLPDFKIQILKILKKERKREKELQK